VPKDAEEVAVVAAALHAFFRAGRQPGAAAVARGNGAGGVNGRGWLATARREAVGD
jgi:hypothetical protein